MCGNWCCFNWSLFRFLPPSASSSPFSENNHTRWANLPKNMQMTSRGSVARASPRRANWSLSADVCTLFPSLSPLWCACWWMDGTISAVRAKQSRFASQWLSSARHAPNSVERCAASYIFIPKISRYFECRDHADYAVSCCASILIFLDEPQKAFIWISNWISFVKNSSSDGFSF